MAHNQTNSGWRSESRKYWKRIDDQIDQLYLRFGFEPPNWELIDNGTHLSSDFESTIQETDESVVVMVEAKSAPVVVMVEAEIAPGINILDEGDSLEGTELCTLEAQEMIEDDIAENSQETGLVDFGVCKTGEDEANSLVIDVVEVLEDGGLDETINVVDTSLVVVPYVPEQSAKKVFDQMPQRGTFSSVSVDQYYFQFNSGLIGNKSLANVLIDKKAEYPISVPHCVVNYSLQTVEKEENKGYLLCFDPGITLMDPLKACKQLGLSCTNTFVWWKGQSVNGNLLQPRDDSAAMISGNEGIGQKTLGRQYNDTGWQVTELERDLQYSKYRVWHPRNDVEYAPEKCSVYIQMDNTQGEKRRIAITSLVNDCAWGLNDFSFLELRQGRVNLNPCSMVLTCFLELNTVQFRKENMLKEVQYSMRDQLPTRDVFVPYCSYIFNADYLCCLWVWNRSADIKQSFLAQGYWHSRNSSGVNSNMTTTRDSIQWVVGMRHIEGLKLVVKSPEIKIFQNDTEAEIERLRDAFDFVPQRVFNTYELTVFIPENWLESKLTIHVIRVMFTLMCVTLQYWVKFFHYHGCISQVTLSNAAISQAGIRHLEKTVLIFFSATEPHSFNWVFDTSKLQEQMFIPGKVCMADNTGVFKAIVSEMLKVMRLEWETNKGSVQCVSFMCENMGTSSNFHARKVYQHRVFHVTLAAKNATCYILLELSSKDCSYAMILSQTIIEDFQLGSSVSSAHIKDIWNSFSAESKEKFVGFNNWIRTIQSLLRFFGSVRDLRVMASRNKQHAKFFQYFDVVFKISYGTGLANIEWLLSGAWHLQSSTTDDAYVQFHGIADGSVNFLLHTCTALGKSKIWQCITLNTNEFNHAYNSPYVSPEAYDSNQKMKAQILDVGRSFSVHQLLLQSHGCLVLSVLHVNSPPNASFRFNEVLNADVAIMYISSCLLAGQELSDSSLWSMLDIQGTSTSRISCSCLIYGRRNWSLICNLVIGILGHYPSYSAAMHKSLFPHYIFCYDPGGVRGCCFLSSVKQWVGTFVNIACSEIGTEMGVYTTSSTELSVKILLGTSQCHATWVSLKFFESSGYSYLLSLVVFDFSTLVIQKLVVFMWLIAWATLINLWRVNVGVCMNEEIIGHDTMLEHYYRAYLAIVNLSGTDGLNCDSHADGQKYAIYNRAGMRFNHHLSWIFVQFSDTVAANLRVLVTHGYLHFERCYWERLQLDHASFPSIIHEDMDFLKGLVLSCPY